MFENGKCVSQDYLADITKLDNFCTIRSNNIEDKYIEPETRTPLEMSCPLSFEGFCEEKTQYWKCHKCLEIITFGFDDYFYCKCGRSKALNCNFKCNASKHHGLPHVNFSSEEDFQGELRKLTPKMEMNILLLGETGVGKSTLYQWFC